MKLNILHLNIERSKHINLVSDLIKNKNPDVVCFEEAMYKDISEMATNFGYEFAFAPIVILKKENGDTDKEGCAILSKYPIKDIKEFRYDNQEVKDLIIEDEEGIISKNYVRPKNRFLLRSNLLTISILLEGEKMVTISTTHFPVVDHTVFGLKDHELHDIENVLEVEKMDTYLDRLISLIRSLNNPLIFTADLNNPRGEYIYDTLAHELIDIVPISVSSTIDPQLHRRGHDLKLTVDTIMTSSDISVDNFELIEGVSDHKGLIASLVF
jgi:endonuclease/exonuclease/phosphatase family metal-dependent hydrolase